MPHLKLILQNGQVLIDCNPVDKNIRYVSNLDVIWSTTGSKYSKIELDNYYLYGSTLEITYTLTIQNDSDISYKTEEYYRYGEAPKKLDGSIDTDKEVTISVNALLEYLDPLLRVKNQSDIAEGSGDNSYTYNNKEIQIKSTTSGYRIYEKARDTLVEIESGNDITKKDDLKNKFTKVYEIAENNKNDAINNIELSTLKSDNEKSATKVKIVAQRILASEQDDLEYTSYAQISEISTISNIYSDPTAIPIVEVDNILDYQWNESIPFKYIPASSSKIVATPTTGLDRSMKYYVTILIYLGTFAILIICIKK